MVRQAELQELQAKYDRLQEYAAAAVSTLMHERRYGPAPGAPGTGINSKHLYQYGGRLVVFPLKGE